MSIRMVAAVFDCALDDKGDMLVMLALANFADERGTAYPSIGRIARMARMEPRSVQRILRSLERRGYIRTTRSRGGRQANTYEVIPHPAGASQAKAGPSRGDARVTPDTVSPHENHDTVSPHPRHRVTRPLTPVSPHPRHPCHPNHHRTVKEGGGGDARARDAEFEDPFREEAPGPEPGPHPGPEPADLGLARLRAACKVPSGRACPEGWGDAELRPLAERWQQDLGLTPDEIVEEAAAVAERMADPMRRPSYLTSAMQRRVQRKARAAQPIARPAAGGDDDATRAQTRAQSRASTDADLVEAAIARVQARTGRGE